MNPSSFWASVTALADPTRRKRTHPDGSRAIALTVEAMARPCLYEHKSHIIVGGLGGFGLDLAEWMVTRGCRKLLLAGRSGAWTGYQRICLHRWRSFGVTVVANEADASVKETARQIIEEAVSMGPIGGIFNLAVVLHYALIENQTAETFAKACKPKIVSTQLLDELSREVCPDLDHFVVFSSVSSGRGNVGQTNYGFASSAAERICDLRVADGLPGLAMQWGAIGDVGRFYETKGEDEEVNGIVPQRITSCMTLMDSFLSQRHPVVASYVKLVKRTTTKVSGKRDLIHSLGHILGIKDSSSVDTKRSLGDFGIDSLMSVEVKHYLERDYDLSLSMQDIRELTITRLQEIAQGGVNTRTGQYESSEV